MGRHFFFYGTLRPDLAQGLPARLIERLYPVGAATMKGRIYARRDPGGTYPVLLRSGIGMVHGVVCRAKDGFSARELAALNRYEGREYIRRAIPARLGNGMAIAADAYIYAGPMTADMIPILHGDFMRFLAETGDRPFA